jgi:hypothetical protein
MSWLSDTTGGAATTQLLGMIGGHQQERRNYRNNQKLMGLQNQYQRGLNQQGHDLQMDMWNKTNYGAQVEHMKNAGLNPALMYKGAGAGGTTGSQGGGSASMGSSQQGKVMDLQNALIGKQAALLDSQKNKTDAETRNILGDTDESKGRIAKLIAERLGLEASKVKTIQETTNLKTLDEWNKVKKGLDELKESKKVTGSQLVDLLTSVGLDPVNNEEDMIKVQGLMALIVGSSVAEKFIRILKPKIKTNY